MTMLSCREIQCGICGTKTSFDVVCSTNAQGSSDLDTRPPEMERSTIKTWIQQCPVCGYCRFDLGECDPKCKALVNSNEYRFQLLDTVYPKLATSFLCAAIIDRALDQYAVAAWAIIYAAWACDDAERPELAKECRSKAASMLILAEKHQQLDKEGEEITGVLVDLLRRSGQFDQAKQVIEERRPGIKDVNFLRILDFQAYLIQNGDTSRHCFGEITGIE